MTTTVGRYRRRSTRTSAVQYTGTAENVAAIHAAFGTEGISPRPGHLILTTRSGTKVPALPGDWVLTDAAPGRFYPCNPAVFTANYREV